MNETYDYIISLVTVAEKKNNADETLCTKTSKEVYADISELTQYDFNQAQAQGFRPEIKFVLSEYLEYNGESLIEYDEKYYKVMQTRKSKTGREISFICESTVNPWEVNSDANAEISSEV